MGRDNKRGAAQAKGESAQGMGQPEAKDKETAATVADQTDLGENRDREEPVNQDKGPSEETREEILHLHPTTPAHKVLYTKILVIKDGRIGRFSDEQKKAMILDLAKQCEVRKDDFIPDDARLQLVLDLLRSVASISSEIPKEILAFADTQIGEVAVDACAEEIGMPRKYCGGDDACLADPEAWPEIKHRIRSEREAARQKSKCDVCPSNGHCSIQSFIESHPGTTEEEVLKMIGGLISSGSPLPNTRSHGSRASREVSLGEILGNPEMMMDFLMSEGFPFRDR